MFGGQCSSSLEPLISNVMIMPPHLESRLTQEALGPHHETVGVTGIAGIGRLVVIQ